MKPYLVDYLDGGNYGQSCSPPTAAEWEQQARATPRKEVQEPQKPQRPPEPQEPQNQQPQELQQPQQMPKHLTGDVARKSTNDSRLEPFDEWNPPFPIQN